MLAFSAPYTGSFFAFANNIYMSKLRDYAPAGWRPE
jgi:hypothetical protein